MNDVAIVTGASSGIGLEISKVLCKLGYEVYGLGRTFQEQDLMQFQNNSIQVVSHEESLKVEKTKIDSQEVGREDANAEEVNAEEVNAEEVNIEEVNTDEANRDDSVRCKGIVHPIICDLLDTGKLENTIRTIKKEKCVKVLVNNAGAGYYGLHEELNPGKIREMVRVNLEVPMVLTNLLLRDIKKSKGTIINISSVTATSSNPHGCAYGATKAGLTSFAHSLFDEARKYGVKVINIQPDMTKTNLYRNANFTNSEDEGAYLLPEDVAGAVEFVLSRREGCLVTDISLKPQFHRIQRK